MGFFFFLQLNSYLSHTADSTDSSPFVVKEIRSRRFNRDIAQRGGGGHFHTQVLPTRVHQPSKMDPNDVSHLFRNYPNGVCIETCEPENIPCFLFLCDQCLKNTPFEEKLRRRRIAEKDTLSTSLLDAGA